MLATPIVCAGDVPVVDQAQVDIELPPHLASEGELVLRQGDTHDRAAVALRGVRGETTPAAADVEHPHAGLETELAADEVELRLLCLREG